MLGAERLAAEEDLPDQVLIVTSREAYAEFLTRLDQPPQPNECLKLSGFGNFQLRDKPQRPGRNPKTGEEMPIHARRVTTFHASQKLKFAVEGVGDGNKA
ncbi:MAG: HU family DNA-binding protein [Hydrogenophilales bacterium]|nr:HU family DNA-binding protein [Hydrogenophilales bacterium]